jgi:hypothetical protein
MIIKIKIIIILVLFFSLFSCNVMQSNWDDIQINDDLSNYTEKEIFQYVCKNIEYERYSNGYQNSQKTWDEKKGNCCNRALVTLALIQKYKNIKLNLAIVSMKNMYICDHATIENMEKYMKVWDIINYNNIGYYISIYQGRF